MKNLYLIPFRVRSQIITVMILILALLGCKSGTNVDALLQESTTTPATIGNSAVSFSPENYNFGNLSLNASAQKTITLENIAASGIYISSLTVNSSQYTIISDTCPRAPSVFATGEKCNAVIKFLPTSSGSQGVTVTAFYGTHPEETTRYYALGGMTGSGVSPLSFAGLTSITPITTKTFTLNWTANSSVTTFQVFRISGATSVFEQAVLNPSGTVASTTVTGLTANTSYTFRVRAIDTFGQTEANVVDVTASTDPIGTFTTGTLSTSEGSTGTLNLATLCTDTEGNTPTSFTLNSQTSTNAAPNCTISGNTLSCTPAYKTGHAAWAETTSVTCALNESNITQTLTVSVADTNTAASLAAISNQTNLVAGSAITQIDANGASDTQADGDAYTYTCYYDTTVDGAVASTTACSSLSGGSIAYSFSSTTGVFDWTPGYAQGGSTYEFKIIANDGNTSASRIFTIQVIPAVPIIQHVTAGNKNFPTTYLDQAVQLSVNFGNYRTGSASDTGMSYTCYFDNNVDGAVAASTACSSLPGTVDFSTFSSDGVFTWTPSTAVFGPFEIKVTGTNVAGSASEIYIVDVRAGYSLTNLIASWDASFATLSGNGLNASPTGTLYNLTSGGVTYDGTLSNFGYTTATGWTGDNTATVSSAATGPYRLAFDGTNDKVSLGTGLNSLSSNFIDLWIRPTSVSSLGAVILDNSDVSNKGLKLLQSKSVPGTLELQVGQRSYYDEVMADSPAFYSRLNSYGDFFDATGANGKASSSTGVTSGTTGALATYGGDPDKATTFASGYVTYPDSPSLSIASSSTYEAWIKPSALSGTQVILHKEQHFTFATSGTTLTFAHSGNWSYANTNTGGPYGTLTTSTWYHVAVVHTVGVGYTFYVNGVQAGSAFANTSAMTDNANSLCIGAYNCGSMYFPGVIDEVAIYPTALSPARIAAHYAARNRPLCRTSSIMGNGFWHHIAGFFDSVAGNLQLFVNGKQECTTTAAGSVIQSSTSAQTLGADVSGGNAWAGAVGELRAYSSGTSTEVATNFSATSAKYNQYLPRSNMKLWVSADSTKYAATNTVAELLDLSGNGFNLTQSTAANRPTLTANGINTNLPSLTFDGTNDRLYNSSWNGLSGSTKASIFFVTKNSNPGLNKVFLSDSSAYLRLQTYQQSGNRWIFSTGTAGYDWYYVDDATVPTDTWQIVEIIFDGSQTGNINRSKFYTDGAQRSVNFKGLTVPATLGNAGAQTFNLGSWTDGGYNPTGGFAELIIYSDALTDADRLRVERYLGGKYGITVP
jgi:hypothetical protein